MLDSVRDREKEAIMLADELGKIVVGVDYLKIHEIIDWIYDHKDQQNEFEMGSIQSIVLRYHPRLIGKQITRNYSEYRAPLKFLEKRGIVEPLNFGSRRLRVVSPSREVAHEKVDRYRRAHPKDRPSKIKY